MGWSLPLFTLWGIRVSVHWLFIAWIALSMYRESQHDQPEYLLQLASYGIIFGIVLIHEFGHCIACRKVGGQADDILLWPLGGLAMCKPPHNWRDELITVVGGPIVHVFLWPILAAAVYFTKSGSLLFPLFDPWAGLAIADIPHGLLYFAYFINILLFLFNMLLVMYPMDAGRVLQCVLWWRLGERRSRDIAATVGLIAAGAVVVYGLSNEKSLLVTIAILGGFVCWQEKQKVKAGVYNDDVFAPAGGWQPSGPGDGRGLYNYDTGYAEDEPKQTNAERRRAHAAEKARQKLQESAEQQQAELDRILAKIKRDGMDALTRKEKAFLERDTKRRRGA
ncbi:MAG: hypothetical protein H6815_13050 [Phycisphaeraceae bacterium]|nr:hypothetical protein [Phycisphaerales bacterium]MCB9861369.1 hypothetical protein [Phycisphaeraceae bacterium]